MSAFQKYIFTWQFFLFERNFFSHQMQTKTKFKISDVNIFQLWYSRMFCFLGRATRTEFHRWREKFLRLSDSFYWNRLENYKFMVKHSNLFGEMQLNITEKSFAGKLFFGCVTIYAIPRLHENTIPNLNHCDVLIYSFLWFATSEL